MSNNDPNSAGMHGLDFASAVEGHLRGETPLATLQRQEHEARAREIQSRSSSANYIDSSEDYRHAARAAPRKGRGLGALLKLAMWAALVVISVVLIAVAVPQTRYPALWGLSELARLPDDIVPPRAGQEPPLLLISRALGQAPAKERLNAAKLQRFDARVLVNGVSWQQLNAQQRGVVLAAYRAKTEPYAKEEYWMLTRAERARFDHVFASMINAAAVADQATANRASRLLSGVGAMDTAAMARLQQTPFAGDWRARVMWLSNQLMYRAELARRSQGQRSIEL